jgi:hypothetical protein
MPNFSQYERDEDQIEQDYAEGRITLAERNQAMRELQADWRAGAEEAAERAYRDEFDRWA